MIAAAANAVGSVFRRGSAADSPQAPGTLWANALADFVEKEFKRRQDERRPDELQWRMNGEFVNGNQYLDINTATNSLQLIPKIWWWQEREVFNHIAPIYETRVARLQRSKPILKVRPASGDPDDINAARVDSRILAGTYNDLAMKSKLNDAVAWVELQGTVFLGPVWDPKAGRQVYSGPDPNAAPDDQNPSPAPGGDLIGQAPGNPDDGPASSQSRTITVHEGDVDTEIWPAHEVYPDSPWRNGVADCRSLIHARAYHVDEIFDTWGVKVDPEDVDALSLRGTTNALGGLGYGSGSFYSSTIKLKRHAVVKKYMERPSTKYPNGRMIVVANKTLLFSGDLPYAVGPDEQRDLGVVRIVSIMRPGYFWGKSVVERLIPIQRRYNALRNRKAEHLNRAAIGQWYKPTGSADDESLNTAPGQIVEYDAQMGRPEPVVWPALPVDFETEEQTLLNEFTIISGVSELSRFSNAPPGVKAGIALSIAQEQDDTRLSSTASRIEEGLIETGRYWLRLYKQFVAEPRILRYVGDNNVVEVQDWTASDIRSDDVYVEAGVGLAETPAQRRQMIFDLLNFKDGALFSNAQGELTSEAKAKILELMEFGNWEEGADDEDKLQRGRAERETRQLAQRQDLPIAEYDDNLVHIGIHNRFRLTTEYETLLKGAQGFEIQMAFQSHVDAHMQALSAQVFQAQQMQGPQPGPGFPGQQAPPAPNPESQAAMPA